MSYNSYSSGAGIGKDREVSRIYVGNLPTSATQSDIEELFQRFGRITRCDIKRTVSGAPFAFLEYEDARDAKEAIEARDGYNFDGCSLRVEIPFNARPEGRGGGGYRGRGGGGGGGGRGGGQRGKYRLSVSGLPPTGSWQDLKDHMRKAGECGHADVFGDGTGIIDFFRRDDLEAAIKLFDQSTFSSHEGDKSTITVREDMSYRGAPNGGSPDYGGGYDRGRRSPTPTRYGGGRYQDDDDRRRGRSFSPRRGRGGDRGYGRDRYEPRYDRRDRDYRGGRDDYRNGDYGRYSPSPPPSGYRGRRSYSRDRGDRGDRGRNYSAGRSRSRDRR